MVHTFNVVRSIAALLDFSRVQRKAFRADRPFGFMAKPREVNGEINMFLWDCRIYPKKGSDFEGPEGYSLEMHFADAYPGEPPKCVFNPKLMHPNVYPSGAVKLRSFLYGDREYTPALGVKQLLLDIQELLDAPNNKDPVSGGTQS